jgi:hypothetical protein
MTTQMRSFARFRLQTGGVDGVGAQLAIESASIKTEDTGRLGLIAIGLPESMKDPLRFVFAGTNGLEICCL